MPGSPPALDSLTWLPTHATIWFVLLTHALGFLVSMVRDDDIQLLAGYVSGDAEALKTVDSWILGMVRSRAWGPDLPTDDIVQECRLGVHQSLSKGAFQGRASLRSYVFSIAANICLTWIRKKCRKVPMVSLDEVREPPDTTEDPLRALIRSEDEDTKTRLVNAIYRVATPGCRDLWRMVYYENLKYEDIAVLLGVEIGTVKSRISRCKAKARKAFRMIEEELGLDAAGSLEL